MVGNTHEAAMAWPLLHFARVSIRFETVSFWSGARGVREQSMHTRMDGRIKHFHCSELLDLKCFL
eukprot:3437763-Amphidinium_carterae.2